MAENKENEKELGVISQDEIDQLMNSSRDDAPQQPGPKEEPGDEFDVISQDDIDALINAGPAKQESKGDAAGPDDELGVISQSDIDALLGGGGDSPEAPAGDVVSQSDIDALLGGGGDSPEAPAGDQVSQSDIDALFDSGGSAEGTLDNDVVSQDDIDALMGDLPGTPDIEDDEEALISQEDIDALMEGGGAIEATSEPSTESGELISQADIDALMEGGGPIEATSEPQTESSDLISQADIDALMEGGGPIEATPEPETESADLISQTDIDALMEGGGPIEAPPEPGTESADLISQTDIDALMNTAAGEEEEAGVISRSEIDNLLSGVLEEEGEEEEEEERDSVLLTQEMLDGLLNEYTGEEEEIEVELPEEPGPGAEEVLLSPQDGMDDLLSGEPAKDLDKEEVDGISPNAFDQVLPQEEETAQGISQDAIDQLLELDGGEEEGAITAESDQVVLEPVEEEPVSEAVAPEEAAETPKRRWYASKLFRIAASVVVAVSLGIGSFFTYRMFFTEEAPMEEIAQVTETVEQPLPEEILPELPEIYTADFPGFVVLAPAGLENKAYLSVDIKVDFVSPESASELKRFQPYLRNVIYDVLVRALAESKKGKIKQAGLKKAVRDALNNSLPGKGVENVVLNSLVTS